MHSQLAVIQGAPSHLSAAEAELLQQINLGLSSDLWSEYHTLIDKRHAETLTADEHQRLIELSDQIEALNVERIQALVRLATLRQQSLEDVKVSLGIKSGIHG